MKSQESQFYWQTIVLGAMNGLLFGGAAELVRRLIGAYQERDLWILERTDRIAIDVSDPIKHMAILVPVVSGLLFAVASILVHRFQDKGIRPIPLWLTIGFVAVAELFLLVLTVSWLGRQHSDAPVGFGVFPLILEPWLYLFGLVSAFNMVYGILIHLALSRYSQAKKMDFI